MSFDETVLLFAKLAVGAFAGFCAILVWSRTRDVAWMLVVIAVIAQYGHTVFVALERFGVVRLAFDQAWANRTFAVALEVLPSVFLSIGLLVVFGRRR